MNNYKLIKCGKMFDGIHEEMYENMEILVKDNVIEEVGKNLAYPEGTKIINLSGSTVTPGMIDAHVHLSQIDVTDKNIDAIHYSNGWRTLAALYSAKRCLHAGFTTVRHLGWFAEDYILDVKRMIDMGLHEGARVIAAPHLLGTTGSHGDGSQSFNTNPDLADWLAYEKYPTIGCGQDFFVNAVRRERKLGADFIKIMVSGGVMSKTDQPTDVQLNDEELAGIFDTAKSLGISVTAHNYGAAGVKKLVKFGIDGIEHGTMMDEEAARMMEDAGTYVVPTFAPGEDATINGEKGLNGCNPAFIKFVQRASDLKAGRQVIMDSNIKLIGYGTDFVVGCRHQVYECGKEYWCYLTHGMGAYRSLKAATSVNAQICGLADKVGTLEKGKLADISAWDADLLIDPYGLTKCVFVMKDGKEYEPEYQYGNYCKFEDLLEN